MGTGDVEVYGPTTPDKLDAVLTAASLVVTDDVTMASYANGMVVVLVIKA